MYAGTSSNPWLLPPRLYNRYLWSQQQAYLCMQDHHQTLDYCHHSTCTATEICDHNKKPYANPYATVSQSVPLIHDHHLLLLLLLLLLHQNDACSKHLLLRSTDFNRFLQPLSLSLSHTHTHTSDDVFFDTETFSLFWLMYFFFWHACWFCDFVSFINFLFPVFPTIAIWFSSVLRRHSNATDRTSPLVRQVRDLWLQPVGCSSCVCLREALQIGCILFLLPSFLRRCRGNATKTLALESHILELNLRARVFKLPLSFRFTLLWNTLSSVHRTASCWFLDL